jgi:hypothetical protein
MNFNTAMDFDTIKRQLEDTFLPTLFDQYENGNRHGIDFDINKTLTAEEKPAFDSWIGEALANGWIERYMDFRGLYLLTAIGYRHFMPRMNFLRAFQG